MLSEVGVARKNGGLDFGSGSIHFGRILYAFLGSMTGTDSLGGGLVEPGNPQIRAWLESIRPTVKRLS